MREVRVVCKNTFHTASRQPLLFTEEQMRLFGVAQPKARRGRLDGDVRSKNAYNTRTNKCQYAVTTAPYVGALRRTWVAPITNTLGNKSGEVQVSMQANEDDRVGYGFCTVVFRQEGQESVIATVDTVALRGIAQMLNAACNSSRAVWRKSSITL